MTDEVVSTLRVSLLSAPFVGGCSLCLEDVLIGGIEVRRRPDLHSAFGPDLDIVFQICSKADFF